VAVGENIAAPRPANARVKRAMPKVGATAVARFETTKIVAPASSMFLRGTEAATAAMTGARSANVTE
jgi:hypothetical protein